MSTGCVLRSPVKPTAGAEAGTSVLGRAPGRTGQPAVFGPREGSTATKEAFASITGSVAFPKLLNNNGGSLIGNNAAGVISNNAGGVISNNAGGYRIAAVEEVAPSNVIVYLADVTGTPIPGMPKATTDAKGQYTFKAVPPGFNYVVMVEYTTPGGRTAQLQGFAKADEGAPNKADVSMASTFVANSLLDGRTGALGEFKSETFLKAIDTTRKHLTEADVELLFDRKAMLARMKALAEQVAELRDTVAALNTELAQVKKSLDELQSQLDKVAAERDKLAQAGAVLAPLAQSVETFAGMRGTGKSPDGQGTAASFNGPTAVAADAAGNIYVADRSNGVIRKIAQDGAVTTFSGATGTGFNAPQGVAFDTAGNLYVADGSNHRIRRVAPDGTNAPFAGEGVAGLADGVSAAARFNNPHQLAVDAAGNVYVADASNHAIRKITAAGLVSTLGGGTGAGYAEGGTAASKFNGPCGVAVDATGTVYVADTSNHRIRKIAPDGTTTTLAGTGSAGSTDGAGTAAKFNFPRALTVDAAGNLYVAESSNHRIRKVTPAGVVSTVAGSYGYADGTGTAALFNAPYGIALTPAGELIVADRTNQRVRKVTTAGVVTTLAGNGFARLADGPAASAMFITPRGACFDPAGNLYVADTDNHVIRKVATDGTVSTYAGTGVPGFKDGGKAVAMFSGPYGVFWEASGSLLVADYNNHRIRRVAPDGSVSTVAGTGSAAHADGPAASAKFNLPRAVVADGTGTIYVADTYNHRIRQITPDGTVSTLAGSGTAGLAEGAGAAAQFQHPSGLAIDAGGNLFVADYSNHRIRKVTPQGVVTTHAGDVAGHRDEALALARFNGPQGLAFDGNGNLFVADTNNHRIRKIGTDGRVGTFAGSASGYTEGKGDLAQFRSPVGLAIDGQGRVYVGDTSNMVIRRAQ
jgi:sugar lactone lactonase YvrE/uncharacterized coiled-coil protein SlyX